MTVTLIFKILKKVFTKKKCCDIIIIETRKQHKPTGRKRGQDMKVKDIVRTLVGTEFIVHANHLYHYYANATETDCDTEYEKFKESYVFRQFVYDNVLCIQTFECKTESIDEFLDYASQLIEWNRKDD